MKTRVLILAFAVAAVIGLSPAAHADGPVTIGTNGGPMWLVRDANISWIRLGPYWNDINTAPGVFNYTQVDQLLEDCDYWGLKYLFVLSGSPDWCNGGDPVNAKPCSIDAWKAFVTDLTLHIKNHPKGGVVGAFEIWNEPESINSETPGVGWNQDVYAYPRYVDYMAEAAMIIRHNLPGVKVVAGSFTGHDSDLGRLRTILSQIENTYYIDAYDGQTRNASDYVDVISGHMNVGNETHSYTAAYLYRRNVLHVVRDYNPRNQYKEQWITEFGWKSDIGEDSQRKRTKNFLIEMTGGPGRYLQGWWITHAFIYVTDVAGVTRSIYFPPPAHTPKRIVTYYLKTLPFPAIQQPGVPLE